MSFHFKVAGHSSTGRRRDRRAAVYSSHSKEPVQVGQVCGYDTFSEFPLGGFPGTPSQENAPG